ncbi:hypothetical protein PTKU64_94200 (plasmid) [Paraburkholderia terrae]|uniref:Uncharacterized protein n=1 Tax=Paraburkholderia terrae TaxID=311230 RepID=A0ABN6JXT6_9BURK|nr:hypothetical protein PTKU64_94200 [Paraburkholderia terrae]
MRAALESLGQYKLPDWVISDRKGSLASAREKISDIPMTSVMVEGAGKSLCA